MLICLIKQFLYAGLPIDQGFEHRFFSDNNLLTSFLVQILSKPIPKVFSITKVCKI